MGRINSRGNIFNDKKNMNNAYMYAIHRARVTDVHISDGTCDVTIEGHANTERVNFPLIGLSVPPSGNSDESNSLQASWARYIPQRGDVFLVGRGSNGNLYAMGYHAVYYPGFGVMDQEREDRGGIGWGEASGRNLQPGDFDIKSGRNASLYIGDKVKISSGPHSLVLSQVTNDTTVTSGLIKDTYGEASEDRKGEARRFLLPTDTSETSIPSAINPLQTAQERTSIVKHGSVIIPGGVEIVRESMGEVIDELTFLPKISTFGGKTIRYLLNINDLTKDPTGNVPAFTKEIDDFGNQGVTALSAVMFQWVTPTATWNISNTNTSITSTASYTVTSPVITFSATGSIIADAPSVSLGGPASVEPLVMGLKFQSSLAKFLTAVSAAGKTASVVTTPADIAKLAAAWGAVSGFADALNAELAQMLSKKVRTS